MLTREAVERDPELLDRLLLEHRILAEMVEHCPLKLALYDAEDRLLAWNTGYAELYPEAFEAHRTAAEHGTLTYRQVITTEVASRIADPDARAAEIDALMAAHAAADGTAVERAYSHAGCLRVVKVRLPSGGVAGFAIDINDLKDRERELAAAKRTAERAETRLAAALEAVPAALGLFDENDQLVFGNSAFFDAACLAEIYGPGSAMSDLALAAAEAGWGEVLAQPPDPSTAREMGLAGGRFTRIEATRTAAGDL
ncbi:MAG: PAS-domain containing protein, partial [Pseudomonadota bacterium]